MSETDKTTRPRLVLPPGSTVDDLFANIPADVADRLKQSCDIVTDSDRNSDPRIATALDGLGEGVAVVVDRGEIVWMNDRLANHPPEILREFSDRCAQAISEFEAHPEIRDGEAIRLGFDHGDRSFEVICSPMPDDPKRHRITALLSDVTEYRITERLVEQLDLAGGELLNLDPETINPLDVGARLQMLEDKVVRTIRGLIGFEHFEIRLVDQKTGQLELVMGSGMQALPIGERIYARDHDNGICGWVASSGKPYLCRDTATDPLYVTGIDDARSSLTVPLRLHDRVVGVLNVESTELDDFDERDAMAMEIYGRYIAMAANILDMLVVERYTTNKNFSSTVLGELASPLDAITRQAEGLQKSQADNEDVNAGMDAILDAVELIRNRVLACSAGPNNVLGAEEGDSRPIKDPLIKGKRFLVADDEEVIRRTIAAILKRRGGVVETHQNGAEAIAKVEACFKAKEPFDLVISDVRMPECNGYEVFRAAKACDANLPVILMTGFGYDPNHSIVRSSQEGLEAFLFKPFQIDQLLAEIHKALLSKSTDTAD
ncbi:MAG: response regulator [Phycisphaerales bacterium]|nr:response regulator [Phycisphaerales bacterium]